MTLRWITDRLATAAWITTSIDSNYTRIDVRDLIDGPGNDLAKIREKIEAGIRELTSSSCAVVVCCDWGASRSNAIAAGILSRIDNISVADAFRRVVKATGEHDIKVDMYEAVRRALESAPSSRAKRRIAVLGAGSALGRYWAEYGDDNTLFLSRSSIDLLSDLTAGVSQLGEAGVTDLVLLAQPARPFGRDMVGGMVAMTYSVLELARAIRARLVIPSSIAVFGSADDRANLTPDYPRQPRDDFGFAKSAAETLAESYAQSCGVPLLIVRFSHLYGPNNRRPTVLVNALEQILRDAPITLHRFRNGLPELDLLTMEDGVRALRTLARSNQEGIVHVGSGSGTPIRNAIETLISLAGSKSDISFATMNSDTRRHVLQGVDKNLFTPPGAMSLEAGLRQLLGTSREPAARVHDDDSSDMPSATFMGTPRS